MFIPAEYVNNVTQYWTFISAVSFPPCAEFLLWILFVGLLYPQAVWSNQRRAALIAWPWQEARWSGTGHHRPGERSPLILSLSILTAFLSLHLLPQPGTRDLQSLCSRCAGKSPKPNALLRVWVAIHLTLNSNIIPFEIILGVGIGLIAFNKPILQNGPPFFHRMWVSQPEHLRRCLSRYGRGLSDLWLIHSSSSCQANITLSDWNMWHSITMRGCDRTSPFLLPSLRTICDIASLLPSNAVYFIRSYSWIPYISSSMSGPPSGWTWIGCYFHLY